MFNKKCPKCKNKIGKTYDFCPFCGKNLKSKYDNEDFGLLGKSDFIDKEENTFGFGGGFMDKMINKAMKMIEKQMREMPNEFNQNPNQNQGKPNPNMHVQFFVNGKKVFPQKLQTPQNNLNSPKKIKKELSKEKAEKFAKLPRKEPKTTMKRLAGKLVYELAMPGVKDVEDVLINQLENSIEVKALSKNKVYSKTLKVNLPIINYELDKGNFILELQTK